MKKLIFVCMFVSSSAFASEVVDVCILKAGKLSTNATGSVSCSHKDETANYEIKGQADNWAVHKARHIKALLNQGYEMKSDEVFVKYKTK